jgi:serine/threonine protein kinase
LVTLSSSFLTPLYTVLVLDYCPGGELFDFLAEYHAEVTEGLARRMFGELCDAVGWMHRVGLVHRDIKLESE